MPKISKLFFPLFVVCIVALSLGQFSVIYKFEGGSLYLFDIMIALFDVIGFVYLLAVRKVLKVELPVFLLLVFGAFGAIALAFTPLTLELSELAVSASYLIRFISYVFFGFVVGNLLRLDVFQTHKINGVIIYSGLFLFITGLILLIFLPDLEVLNPLLGWDPHKNRMVSTFFDPNFLGVYFVVCLAMVLHTTILSQKLRVATLVIFLSGIFLTFSRSAWLATAILILFAGLRRKALLIVSTAIILLAVFAVPRVQTRISGITDPQDSAQFRLVSWKNTWEITKDNWITGVGYNTFRFTQRDYGFLDDVNLASRSGAGSDASLLLVLATTGVFGFFCFTGFFTLNLLKAIEQHDLVTTGLITALLVNSLFINSLFYPQIVVVILLATQVGVSPESSQKRLQERC